MPRIPMSDGTGLSAEVRAKYDQVTGPKSGLAETYKALFNIPGLASKLADLEGQIAQSGLEDWVTLSVGLTVSHESGSASLWESLEPLAREAGVSGAVVDAIRAGTAPRGLLPKEGIWVHFALEVVRNQVRDTTWQAVTHLVGDDGAMNLAFCACYYDMMARLNSAFGLETP